MDSHPLGKGCAAYRYQDSTGEKKVFCGTGTQQKPFGTSGRVQRTPKSPRAKEGTRALPDRPQSALFSTSAAREGKTFAVFGRTRHRKSLSDRDKGSIEVGELQF